MVKISDVYAALDFCVQQHDRILLQNISVFLLLRGTFRYIYCKSIYVLHHTEIML